MAAKKYESPRSVVDCLYDGTFYVRWRNNVVYERENIKRFETEREAQEFLARCDLLGDLAS